MFTILFLGDIVGKPGRRTVTGFMPELKAKYAPDMIIANGENSAGGLGIDPGTAQEIYAAGVDVITTGNHVWSKKEINDYLDRESHRIVRPENYAEGAPGKGVLVWQAPTGVRVLVLNLLGRVFMSDLVDCPFRTADKVLADFKGQYDLAFIDFHAEASSEKVALGYYLDSRVSVIVGTHTHVQTADDRILPGGTAYITDVGMCGPYDGVIGVKAEFIVKRFLTGLPVRFDLAKGVRQVNGVVVRLDEESGRATSMERISLLHDPD